MNTLTIKLPAALEQQLEEATRRTHLSKSELVRGPWPLTSRAHMSTAMALFRRWSGPATL